MRFQIKRCQFVDIRIEDARHDLYKSARARRALVIHDKAAELSAGKDGERFRVLAADIEDGPDAGKKPFGTLRMAAELRKDDVLLIDGVAPVTCRGRGVYIRQR